MPTSQGPEAHEVSHTALSRTWNCEASDMALSPSEMTRTMRCLLQGMPKLEHSRVHSPMAAMRRRHRPTAARWARPSISSMYLQGTWA